MIYLGHWKKKQNTQLSKKKEAMTEQVREKLVVGNVYTSSHALPRSTVIFFKVKFAWDRLD